LALSKNSVHMAKSPTSPDPVAEFLSNRKRLMNSVDDAARNTCLDYVRSKRKADGGYAGPGNRSDLYYTFFALADIVFLGSAVDIKPTKRYISTFGEGESLDLVHLCCLMRCHNLLAMAATPSLKPGRLGRFLQTRRYAKTLKLLKRKAEDAVRVYDLFLVAQTGRELGVDLVSKEKVRSVLEHAVRDTGGFSDPNTASGTTTVTAAASWLHLWMDGAVPPKTVDWFATVKTKAGGFRANSKAPIPDLLSTASAIQALSWAGETLGAATPHVLEFVESCWMDDGSFGANSVCPSGDVEYMYYGLSSLANLLA
jgi:hypothetical protein